MSELPKLDDVSLPPSRPMWRVLLVLAAVAGVAALTCFGSLPNALRWPARIYIILAFPVLVYVCLREGAALSGWVAALFVRWGGTVGRVIGRPLPFVEALAAACILGIALLHFGQVCGSMAQSSLRVDEVGSLKLYSSQGLMRTITTYSLAKNHVFFNAVNSVLPGADSYQPLRARFLSFCAVGLALALAGFWFAQRGWFVEGAVFLSLICWNDRFLETSLEARGYGFLALFSALACIAVWRLLERGGGDLLGLAALLFASVLGIYTVPSFLLWAGPLLLMLFLITRDLRVFQTGAVSALCVAVLYAPILAGVLHVAGGYGENYGGRYTDLDHVAESFAYLIPLDLVRIGGAFSALLIGFAVAGGFLAGPAFRKSATACLATGGACGIFFGCCLVMQTPPMRVTSFVALPMGWALAGVAALLLRSEPTRIARWVVLGLALALVPFGLRTFTAYDFQPREKWKEVGAFLETATPTGAEIWAVRNSNQIEAYLGEGKNVIEGEFSREEFLAGRLLLVDCDPRDHSGTGRLDPTPWAPAARAISFPLRDDEYRIWFVPGWAATTLRVDGKEAALVSGVASPGVSVAQGGSEIEVEIGGGKYAVLFSFGSGAVDWTASSAQWSTDGKTTQLRFAGDERVVAVVLPEGKSGGTLLLRVVPASGSTPVLSGVWGLLPSVAKGR